MDSFCAGGLMLERRCHASVRQEDSHGGDDSGRHDSILASQDFRLDWRSPQSPARGVVPPISAADRACPKSSSATSKTGIRASGLSLFTFVHGLCASMVCRVD